VPLILQKLVVQVDDREDFVDIRLGEVRAFIPYQNAIHLAQLMRVAAKAAALADNAPASFWREFGLEDPRLDTPAAHGTFRRSRHVASADQYHVLHQAGLVRIIFGPIESSTYTELGYADAVAIHNLVRRAAHRAKAWAGDTSRQLRSVGRLTDAARSKPHGIPSY
jgi:hypothetical protein